MYDYLTTRSLAHCNSLQGNTPMSAEKWTYPKYLGQRIKSARMNLGLSQDELADAVGLPRPAISQIENGKRAVDSMELMAFSRVLRQPLSFFLDLPDENSMEEPLAVLYRAEDIAEDDRPLVDDFVALSRDYATLERLLELDGGKVLPNLSAPIRTKWDAIITGEKGAADLRANLSLGLAPLTDLDRILERAGVKLLFRPRPGSGVWGFSVTSKEFGQGIFVNTYCALERQRFTLAHELGHLVMDGMHRASVFTEKQATESFDDGDTVLSEVRANAFAAAFLMPEIAVKDAIAKLAIDPEIENRITPPVVKYLCDQFGVSCDAMLWRLLNLKVISRERRQSLSVMRVSERSSNVVPRSFELPERYRTLAFEAYMQSKISIGKLADYLRTDLYEARKLVKEYHLPQLAA